MCENRDGVKIEAVVELLYQVKQWEKRGDKKYSYHSLAEAINEHSATYMSNETYEHSCVNKDHIFSYLKGRKSEENFKNPSTPSIFRLKAIEKFIFDCTESGKKSGLTFNKIPTDTPISILLISNYLSEKRHANFDTSQLNGSFFCKNEFNYYQLNFSSSNALHILSVRLKIFNLSEENNTSGVSFLGWAVVSPEDYVFIILKNQQNEKNHYLGILEVNNQAYDNVVPIEFFLAIEGIHPFCSLNNITDNEAVQEQTKTETLRFFKRL